MAENHGSPIDALMYYLKPRESAVYRVVTGTSICSKNTVVNNFKVYSSDRNLHRKYIARAIIS
jgi:hypothetical protein